MITFKLNRLITKERQANLQQTNTIKGTLHDITMVYFQLYLNLNKTINKQTGKYILFRFEIYFI
ncbi:hypothetical protein CRG86_016265 [Photobacterium leiognathi]|nr:hypothetical protein CRG86_016265 [Photobacterium leiognathi]